MELREQKGSQPPLIRRMGHSFLQGVSSVITAVLVFPDPLEMHLRRSRKTYGVRVARLFQAGDPPEKTLTMADGRLLCKDLITVFVKEGDHIWSVHHSVKHTFSLIQPRSRIELYATNDRTPKYTSDVGMERIGTWSYTCTAPWEAEKKPAVQIKMCFKTDTIELEITPTNFDGGSLLASVKFENEKYD
ncbi:hypothetical protein R1sor_023474 [Riccia sorocarpa]|uniref:Uncharacterized protein n=1 Tax=Riccia sorocarpa TaxID=122646 RepID=A0ABD3GMV5_9MARC